MQKKSYKKYLFLLLLIITIISIIIYKKSFHDSAPEITTFNKNKYCKNLILEQKNYTLCQVDPEVDDIQLFLNDPKGQPYNNFETLEKALNDKGKKLSLASNAGMFHKDYSPVGLYVENGKELQEISTSNGGGNFFLKPNGVFYIKDKKAAILATEAYIKANIKPDLATQSGPMLVINGEINPIFLQDSKSLKYRNGVGMSDEGKVLLVFSLAKVTFYEFATVFQKSLNTQNALYLDGTISSLYAPEFYVPCELFSTH